MVPNQHIIFKVLRLVLEGVAVDHNGWSRCDIAHDYHKLDSLRECTTTKTTFNSKETHQFRRNKSTIWCAPLVVQCAPKQGNTNEMQGMCIPSASMYLWRGVVVTSSCFHLSGFLGTKVRWLSSIVTASRLLSNTKRCTHKYKSKLSKLIDKKLACLHPKSLWLR